jgi:hypothetical protein
MEKSASKHSDRCEPIRQNIARLEKEVLSIDKDLEPPVELPPEIIKRLEEIRKRDVALLKRLEPVLLKCEAIPAMPERA